jgi:hypothetical protein
MIGCPIAPAVPRLTPECPEDFLLGLEPTGQIERTLRPDGRRELVGPTCDLKLEFDQ